MLFVKDKQERCSLFAHCDDRCRLNVGYISIYFEGCQLAGRRNEIAEVVSKMCNRNNGVNKLDRASQKKSAEKRLNNIQKLNWII